MSSTPKKIVIVGSGIFGTSTGLWLQKENSQYDITILDKSKVIPAPDAASTDLNKIVRSGDYADPEIAALNVDAVEMWRKPEWDNTYHESGVLMLATKGTAGEKYTDSSYENVKSLGIAAKRVGTTEEIHALYPSNISSTASSSTSASQLIPESVSNLLPAAIAPLPPMIASFPNSSGYLNPASGWAEAGRAVEVGLERFKTQGGKVLGGKEVVGLTFEEEAVSEGKKKVKAVKVRSEGKEEIEEYEADLVVLAAGAWTGALFAQSGMGKMPDVVATGQCVAKIQLTPEEVEEYKDIPVLFEMDSGWYIFPPNPQGIMKVALHASGYLNLSNPPDPHSSNEAAAQASGISTPRTQLTPGAHDGLIPKASLIILRQKLAELFPRLAKTKDFLGSRICNYTDTPDGDWIIDWHPEMERVLLATGGSGHAFKFLPNIGREVVARINGTLKPALAHKWRFEGRSVAERDAGKDSDVRAGGSVRKLLVIDELATREDLKAGAIEVVA